MFAVVHDVPPIAELGAFPARGKTKRVGFKQQELIPGSHPAGAGIDADGNGFVGDVAGIDLEGVGLEGTIVHIDPRLTRKLTIPSWIGLLGIQVLLSTGHR